MTQPKAIVHVLNSDLNSDLHNYTADEGQVRVHLFSFIKFSKIK